MKNNKHPSPSETDLDLWQRFVKGVAPIPRAYTTVTIKTQKSQPTKPSKLPAFQLQKCRRPKKGEVRVEATLDLHGLTQEQAHQSINSFLQTAHYTRKRCVLIVTGKGAVDPEDRSWWEERGVLRTIVPHWLESGINRDRVRSYSVAHLKHGGQGALYVFLTH
ncbi:MAG: Smr/MutS family protein [Pseudomonadota bacterium]